MPDTPGPSFSKINHGLRKDFGLTPTECAVADSIYNLCTSPKNRFGGWCNASKAYLAAYIGVDKRTIFRAIQKLEALVLIERDPESHFVMVTDKMSRYMTKSRADRDKMSRDENQKAPQHRDKMSHYTDKRIYADLDFKNYDPYLDPALQPQRALGAL